jgi:hypothetical protein
MTPIRAGEPKTQNSNWRGASFGATRTVFRARRIKVAFLSAVQLHGARARQCLDSKIYPARASAPTLREEPNRDATDFGCSVVGDRHSRNERMRLLPPEHDRGRRAGVCSAGHGLPESLRDLPAGDRAGHVDLRDADDHVVRAALAVVAGVHHAMTS